MKSTLQVAQMVACPPGYDNSKPYFIAETTYTLDGPRTRIADRRFATEAQARGYIHGKQHAAKATDRINVGDRVQHLNGRRGTVIDADAGWPDGGAAVVQLENGGEKHTFQLKHLTKLPADRKNKLDWMGGTVVNTPHNLSYTIGWLKNAYVVRVNGNMIGLGQETIDACKELAQTHYDKWLATVPLPADAHADYEAVTHADADARMAAKVDDDNRNAHLLNILDNMRGGVIDDERAMKSILELFDKPWNTVLTPAPTVANTTPVLCSEPVLHVQRHKLEGRYWMCSPNEPEDGVWSAAIPLYEKEAVTINVGNLTMERVFRRPGMDPLFNLCALQEVFDRIEMALEAAGRTE